MSFETIAPCDIFPYDWDEEIDDDDINGYNKDTPEEEQLKEGYDE